MQQIPIQGMNSKPNGFTLIELMVVIAIIGVLSSIVLGSLHSSVDKSKVASANAEINQIYAAFNLYYDKYNDYPPVGRDHCDMCAQVPQSVQYTLGTWNDIVDLLVTDKFIGRGIEKDPWGKPYVYDKNYRVDCYGYSPICSSGPDQVLETFNCPSAPVAQGDDVCIFIPNDYTPS